MSTWQQPGGYPDWTCQTCGRLVPAGSTHYCPQTNWWQQPNRPVPTVEPLDRVAAALERIADALEKSKP